MEQVGLEAVLKDEDFQRGLAAYLQGVDKATQKTEQGAQGMSVMGQASDALGGALSAVGGVISGGLTIAIEAAVAAFAGLIALFTGGILATRNWGEQVDQLQDLMGLSAKSASEYAFALNTVGVSVEEGAGGFNYFVRNLGASKEALNDAATAYRNSVSDIKAANQEAADAIAEKWSTAQADAAAKTSDIWSQYNERRASMERDLQTQLEDMQDGFNKQVEKSIKDANKSAAKSKKQAEKDNTRSLAELDKDEQKKLNAALTDEEKKKIKAEFALKRQDLADKMTSKMGGVWLQKTPGQELFYLGSCVDLEDIVIPKGDQTLIQCRDANGDYETIGVTQAAPAAVTTTIKRLLFKETDILDELTNCYITVFVMQHSCGRAGIFSGWDRGVILHHGKITAETLSALAAREDAESSISLPVTAWNPAYKVQALTVRQQSIAETTDLRDIAFCNTLQCAGNCGEFKELGTEGFIAGDAPGGGSPTTKADVWWTVNKGVNWENTTGGAAHPFNAGLAVLSNTCFPVDATTSRWLVAREDDGANPAQIAYSDDGGDTWVQVTVGSVAGEGAAEEGALFARDLEHIWFATDAGNVYFSEDGGVTWTLQASATASGGNSLNVIKFSDDRSGWAVGDSDTIIRTTDGGDTWSAITSPTTTDNVTALEVFDKNRVIIGSSADQIFQTWDAGSNWTSGTFTGQSTNGTVKALDFKNHLCGFMLHNPAVGQGYVHQTVDGGKNWKRLDTPANAGLNAQAVIDENTEFIVGNAYGGTGFVAKVSR